MTTLAQNPDLKDAKNGGNSYSEKFTLNTQLIIKKFHQKLIIKLTQEILKMMD